MSLVEFNLIDIYTQSENFTDLFPKFYDEIYNNPYRNVTTWRLVSHTGDICKK